MIVVMVVNMMRRCKLSCAARKHDVSGHGKRV